MREERKRRMQVRRLVSWIVGVLIAAVIILFLIVFVAKLPQKHTLKTANQLAEQHARFHNVQRTYKANIGKPYYTVMGQNSANQPAYAIVSGDWKRIQVMKQKDGLTAENASAIAKRQVKGQVTNAGMIPYQQKPTWVVTVQNGKQLHYVLVNFKNGKVVKKINL
ncbi:DUF5590 domain-containing protein [Fructilactobacillus hinvesii]|uniref:DUF5590 domain-containing protein n=1 Tax=Fructilactobacillus hinvesii TaxID=2940300 RepID=A0ABY5BQY6_9LACO|nr:PepSY domain-containing protein [Fructilactobacillus hinvesii]USS87520.1 DUF5590 domain-containing protein [Fructilactobacillus hinvesii]